MRNRYRPYRSKSEWQEAVDAKRTIADSIAAKLGEAYQSIEEAAELMVDDADFHNPDLKLDGIGKAVDELRETMREIAG